MSGADDPSRWLRYAEDDLRAAKTLLAVGPPWIVCYHAQQAAEKGLKALLVRDEIQFPFTHDLRHLQKLLPSHLKSKALGQLSDLVDWAVNERYPGEGPEPSQDRPTCDRHRHQPH
jgi:HEPN domain-containing protein